MASRGKRRRGRGKGSPLAVLLSLLVLLAAALCYRLPALQTYLSSAGTEEQTGTAEGSGLTVSFLDVGQGDAALLVSGGETVLIDGGPGDAAQSLCGDLDELGVTSIDYMIATHPHEDHIGGLPEVLEHCDVAECWMPDDAADSRIYTTFLETLEEQEVTVTVPEAGDSFTFGDCTATVLAPLSAAEDHNNNSIVLRVVCGENVFLFTGDMEEEEETELLDSGAALSADVLKVAHHGSAYTSSARFLQAVDPQAAVISCGADNSYGHPHTELLQRLEERGVSVFRTDLQGRITVTSDGTQITVSAQREEDAA